MEKEKAKFLTKNDIKSVVKVFSFVLVLALILEAFSLGSFSKMNALTYKNHYTKTYSFLAEPDNTIDIAGIGSSDLYSAFVPMQVFENYGYTSTVISSPHQTTLESFGFMKELLKKQSPKVIIIETDMLYENAPKFNGKEVPEKKLDKLKTKASAFFNNFNSDRFEDIIQSRFSVFTFHDKWKSFNPLKPENPFKGEKFKTCDHGYNFNDSVNPAEENKNMAVTDIFEPIPDNDINYLNKIIKICNEKGIKVLLVEMPTQNSWTYARHNAVQAYADENGLKFIDFNLMFDVLQLDIKKDYRDGGDHLNYFGATKTTAYLCDYIADEYGSVLIDRRNDPSFDYWKDSNKEFRKKYKISELLEKRRKGLK